MNNKQMLSLVLMLFIHPAIADNNYGSDDSTSLGAKVVHNMPYAMPDPMDCPATTGHWSVGSYSCAGDVPASPANSYVQVEDYSGAGSAGFSCDGSNGQWLVDTTTADCQAAPQCSARTVSWSVDGYNCSSSIPAGNANSIATASNTATGLTGQAQYECMIASKNAAPIWTSYQPSNWTCAPSKCVQSTVYVLDENGNPVPSTTCN